MFDSSSMKWCWFYQGIKIQSLFFLFLLVLSLFADLSKLSFPPSGSRNFGDNTKLSTWHRTGHNMETKLMAQKVFPGRNSASQ